MNIKRYFVKHASVISQKKITCSNILDSAQQKIEVQLSMNFPSRAPRISIVISKMNDTHNVYLLSSTLISRHSQFPLTKMVWKRTKITQPFVISSTIHT